MMDAVSHDNKRRGLTFDFEAINNLINRQADSQRRALGCDFYKDPFPPMETFLDFQAAQEAPEKDVIMDRHPSNDDRNLVTSSLSLSWFELLERHNAKVKAGQPSDISASQYEELKRKTEARFVIVNSDSEEEEEDEWDREDFESIEEFEVRNSEILVAGSSFTTLKNTKKNSAATMDEDNAESEENEWHAWFELLERHKVLVKAGTPGC